MDNAFRYADDLGPAKVILIHEPVCGLKAVLGTQKLQKYHFRVNGDIPPR